MKKNKRNTSGYIFNVILAFVILSITGFSKNIYSQPKEEWVSKYNFDKDDNARAMTMDSKGNIIVTGFSQGKNTGNDFLTLKYSQKGEIIWIQRFEGIGSSLESDDEANAIAIDGQDNIYVTGFSTLGRAGRDFCTVKYNSKGDEGWVNYFSGLGNIEDSKDEAVSIAADRDGNIYVAGNSNGAGKGDDICIVKYDNSGADLWAVSLNGNNFGNESAVSVKTDRAGFVYVAGTTEGISSGKDYILAKYDKGGNQLWVNKYNGTGGNISLNDDELSALAVDETGNVYITGTSYGGITAKDFCTIKYNSDGKVLWISRTDNSQVQKNIISDDEAKSIAVTNSGIVYVTGKTTSPISGSDFFTVKLDIKGQKIWSRTYNNQEFGAGDEAASDITLDNKENVFVTGYTNPGAISADCGPGKDFCTIKYSGTGELKWVQEFNGSGGIGTNDDEAFGILTDGKGKIFVMGETTGEETGADYCLIEYTESGLDEDRAALVRNTFRLNDNFPNPFNPSTKISFNIPSSTNVKLAVYDITGREVALLVNTVLTSGNYKYEWNAAQFSSGTYFYRIEADDFIQTKKMLLIK